MPSDVDLTNLALVQVAGLLVLLGGTDTIASVVIAIAARTFSPAYVTSFLLTHVAKVWLPIFALSVIGHGIEPFGIPAIQPASLAATGALAAYAVATIASLKGSFDDH